MELERWYTLEGEGKRDFPASIFFQSAWYREYKQLEDYYASIVLVMMQGKADCNLLVLNPIESVWNQIPLEYAQHLTANAPEIKALETNYTTLFHWLCGAQVDFDYGEEDFLARMSRISVNAKGEPVLILGNSAYTTLLISGVVTLRKTTLKVLQTFQNAGDV